MTAGILIQINISTPATANDNGMTFDPKRFWQLSVLETVSIVTVVASVMFAVSIILVVR